jgi:hypothetical protein
LAASDCEFGIRFGSPNSSCTSVQSCVAAAPALRHPGAVCARCRDTAASHIRCADMLQALLRPATAGIAVGADVDFGVRQLVGSPSSSERDVRSGNGDAAAAALQLDTAQPAQPGAVLLRPLRLRCTAPAGPRHLIDITALPALEGGQLAHISDDHCLQGCCRPLPPAPCKHCLCKSIAVTVAERECLVLDTMGLHACRHVCIPG